MWQWQEHTTVILIVLYIFLSYYISLHYIRTETGELYFQNKPRIRAVVVDNYYWLSGVGGAPAEQGSNSGNYPQPN